MSIASSVNVCIEKKSAREIEKLAQTGFAQAEQYMVALRTLKDVALEDLTRKNALLAFDDLTRILQNLGGVSQLFALVHPEADIRAAAQKIEPLLEQFQTRLYLDADIAQIFTRFSEKGEPLSVAETKLLEEIRRDFRRNGLSLSVEKQDCLRALNEEITRIGQEFDVNLASATAYIELSPDRLAGLPADYRKRHTPQENGLIRVTTDYPDYVPFMTYAHDRQAARELYVLDMNRAMKNLLLLDRLLALRAEKAELLGYANWADYVLETRMAKDSQQVRFFLDDLHDSLKEKVVDEMKAYREAFVRLGGQAEQPIDVSYGRYLEDQIGRERYAFDSQALSEYFPIQAVQQGLFDISSRLFGISFVRVNTGAWHEDVETYDVTAENGQVLARVYLDLYSRADKYKHAAVFGICHEKIMLDGARTPSSAALVCNFPKPGAAAALLSHQEVVTFFHEFGHLLHQSLSASPLASYAGTNVARDFVEAPSQMLEEWAWKRETLDLFARHFKTGEKIPGELFQAMTNARGFGRAIFTSRQLFLADLDQTYHTRAPGFDTTQVMRDLHAKYSPFAFIPNTFFQSTFGHLVGYDAGYYGYQWALSIAKDLLTRFEKEGMMNMQTAREYREAILERGGNMDEGELVKVFLKRETNNEAYKRFLGIS